MSDSLFNKSLFLQNRSTELRARETASPSRQLTNQVLIAKYSTPAAREVIELDQAKRYNVLPLSILNLNGKQLITLAGSSADHDTITALRFITGLSVKITEAAPETVQQAIHISYNCSDDTLRKGVAALERHGRQTEVAEREEESRPKSPVSEFIHTLIEYAVSRGASDIHFTPRREGTFISLRIDGALLNHQRPLCTGAVHLQLISRLKVIGQLNITEKWRPQEARFSMIVNGEPRYFRISIVPTVHGEKAVLRLHSGMKLNSLEELDINETMRQLYRGVVERPNGLVLICGATGSGKTTTAYSVISELLRRNYSLTTIEDPVEIVLPGASQISVDSGRGFGFAESLKAALRQDPDCIFVGEIRESQCADLAFKAAQTGHFVISTLHSGSLEGAIMRLTDLGVTSLTLAQALRLITLQKLVPRLCEGCKVVDLVKSNEFKRRIFRAVGCGECDYSGNKGRVAAGGAFEMEQASTFALGESGPAALLQRIAQGRGCIDIKNDLIALLESGIISHETYARHI
ncbi:MAG: type II/IV secretion system protein [Deltaproteobacteria bacterium]|nr:type II/IV secretion system protein [Deltaproteobacteria bacterium]